jgi:hypothetical protein
LWAYGPNAIAAVFGGVTIHIADQGSYPNTPYVCGQTSAAYFQIEDTDPNLKGASAITIAYVGDPATVFYGVGTPDILFPASAHATGIDPTSGQFIPWQAPSFAALKTAITAGGFGGTIFDLISGNRIIKCDSAGLATVVSGLYGDGLGNIHAAVPVVLDTGAFIETSVAPAHSGFLRFGSVGGGGSTPTNFIACRNFTDTTDEPLISIGGYGDVYVGNAGLYSVALAGQNASLASSGGNFQATSTGIVIYALPLFNVTAVVGAFTFNSDTNLTEWDFKINNVDLFTIDPNKVYTHKGRNRHKVETAINYQILATDDVVVGSIAGGGTLTLPPTPADGDCYTAMASGASAMTLDGNGHNVVALGLTGGTAIVAGRTSLSVIYSSTLTEWLAI